MTRKPKNIEGLSLKKSSLVFILLLLIAVSAIFFLWWRWANLPFDGDDTSAGQTFIVGKGESLSSVAFRLQEEGLIRSGVAFKLLGRMRNLEEKIQTGSFRLKPSQTLQEVIEFLTQGTQDIWLTFPEGWRREEFARRLVNNLENFDQEEFLALTADHEGELFPDTYLLPREASASAVFQFLQGNFQRRFDDDLINQASKAGLSQPEVLILASLVEREAKHEKDRPIVAGILFKRLAAGWPLQVDATMQYALANLRCSQGEDDCNWWLPPTAADKKIDSPYNTYIHKGLPPAPICNPGLSAIKAVIYSQDSEYWFYISDLKGNMHYGRTVEEHNANIQKYLQ